MNLLRFIPIKLTFCLVIGILLGVYLSPNVYFVLGLTVFSLGILTYLFLHEHRKRPLLFSLFVGFTTLCIGLFSVTLRQPINFSDHYSNHHPMGLHLWKIKVREVLKSTDFSDRYVVQCEKLEQEQITGKLLLNVPKDAATILFRIDDELLIYGKMDEIRGPLNPYQFNYKRYFNGLAITHEFRITDQNILVMDHPSPTIFGSMALFRNKIIAQLKKANFGEEQLGVIQALLLGQRNDISETTYNDYKNAGAVHILAVSGLHIGILLLILEFLLRPMEYLPKGKTLKLITIVLLLWGFAFLAGLSPSVVRAVSMFSFVAYALYLNRPGNSFNILALSMFFILLLIDPTLLFQVGFQMSYAAVFAIVWIYPQLQKFWYPKNWLARKVWQLLGVSISAQLGVLPISLFYFHQFPGLFFVSNVLIIPFLGVILGLGILVIVLSLFNYLPDFMVQLYNAIIGGMNNVINIVAQQEAFVFKNISFDLMQLLLAYGIILCLVLVLTKSTFKRTVSFLITIILFQAWLFYASYQLNHEERLWVAYQPRNSILMHQSGQSLSVFATYANLSKDMATDYQVAKHIDSVIFHPLQNNYSIRDKKLWVIDSLGIVPFGEERPDYVLLTQSPKINLDRLIDSVRPRFIISDGSNYKSYVERWRTTCAKRELPFHHTGEKGAYYFN